MTDINSDHDPMKTMLIPEVELYDDYPDEDQIPLQKQPEYASTMTPKEREFYEIDLMENTLHSLEGIRCNLCGTNKKTTFVYFRSLCQLISGIIAFFIIGPFAFIICYIH